MRTNIGNAQPRGYTSNVFSSAASSGLRTSDQVLAKPASGSDPASHGIPIWATRHLARRLR
jgi:hypothetical protein